MANPELEKIGKENEMIFNSLVTNAPVSKLPESLFVQNFLPYFCGERNIAENEDVLPYWFSIAGSASAEVEIIDNNGEPLFRVPAIADTSIIDPKKNRGDNNLAEVVYMSKLYTNQTPIAGENYLNEKLAKQFEKLVAKSDVFGTNEQRWKEIFIRYNKIKPVEIQAGKDDTGKLTDDDFEF